MVCMQQETRLKLGSASAEISHSKVQRQISSSEHEPRHKQLWAQGQREDQFWSYQPGIHSCRAQELWLSRGMHDAHRCIPSAAGLRFRRSWNYRVKSSACIHLSTVPTQYCISTLPVYTSACIHLCCGITLVHCKYLSLSCWCPWSVLLLETKQRSLAWTDAGGYVDVRVPCCLQKPCRSPCSVLSLTAKGKKLLSPWYWWLQTHNWERGT